MTGYILRIVKVLNLYTTLTWQKKLRKTKRYLAKYNCREKDNSNSSFCR